MAATLTKQEAMSTLQSMFPDIDPVTIEAVLRQCRGHMEHTTEQLLNVQAGGDVHAPPVAPRPYEEAPAPPRRGRRAAQRIVVPGSEYCWRTPLPADFLKVPGTEPVLARGQQTRAPPTAEAPLRDLDEEEMAAMFADERFIAALRANPEFADYLQAEQEYLQGTTREERRAALQGSGSQGASQPAQPSGPSTWESFKSGLSSVGSGISSRFSSFAKAFRRGGAGTTQPSQGQGSTGQYAPLVQGEEEGDTTIQLDTLSPSPDARSPAPAPASTTFAIGTEEDDSEAEEGAFVGGDSLAAGHHERMTTSQ